ncbi:MAG: isoprenylcysteine carboxylmethyltransferase family protein [Candidatus Riflebacteria bacterium]|nr:isoprenylcysteine carboxylmethyltransferase family protein [Candidatus Riflebacteria bacterium]
MKTKLKELFEKHGQMIINLILFVSFARFFAIQAIESYRNNEFGITEGIWVVHNIILTVIILIRKKHVSVQSNYLHQTVALAAFFSGAFLDLKIAASHDWQLYVSNIILFISVIAGMITLLNLGKSFGILIAVREVKTNGLYSIVRHPMYGTDILMRFGIIFRHPSVLNLLIGIISTLIYVWRAILEERFLSQFPEYKEYMERVRYRFIPGIF